MAVVKVSLMGDFKRAAGTGEMEVEVPQGGTVLTVVEQVAAMGGSGLAQKLITTDHRIKHGVFLFLDGKQIDTGGTLPSRMVVTGGEMEIMRLSAT